MSRPTAPHDGPRHDDGRQGEREIRDRHEEWFAASEVRDIDAVMRHIAVDDPTTGAIRTDLTS